MAHEQSNCNHLTVTLYIDYETRKYKNANCTNCLASIILDKLDQTVIEKTEFITKKDIQEIFWE